MGRRSRTTFTHSIPDISGMLNPTYAKYKPLWATMKRKGITTYTLLKQYSFSRGTLDSLKQGRNISTATLNDLCNMLDCRVEDVWLYIPDE